MRMRKRSWEELEDLGFLFEVGRGLSRMKKEESGGIDDPWNAG